MEANTSEAMMNCSQPDADQVLFVVSFSWWLDCVLGISIGLTGFLANTFVMPLLLSKKLSNTFNRLLVFLAVFDNIFIFTCILEAIRKHVINSAFQKMAFTYFLYPLQAFALVASMLCTVVLAIERYLAVSRPVEYHIAVVSSAAQPWRRVLKYMVPTVLFSIVFNIPKCLELTVKFVQNHDNHTGIVQTAAKIVATDLRVDANYSFYYTHLTRLFVTGIVPFITLVVLNHQIFKMIRQRQESSVVAARLVHKSDVVVSANTNVSEFPSKRSESEETRRAVVLLIIVIMFLVCNTPRIFLNCYEFFWIDHFQKLSQSESHCDELPVWVHVAQPISLLLMMINSSVNFFIYCGVNATFRAELKNCWTKAQPRSCRKDLGASGGANNQHSDQYVTRETAL